MIVANKIPLNRIISGTWKYAIFNVGICSFTYLLSYWIIPEHFHVPVLIPTVLGTALAFFIGFNNNQAYDRWWEARKIWGCLVNDSRSWARQLIHYLNINTEDKAGQTMVKILIYRHIAFLYALKQGLRKSGDDSYKAYISAEDLRGIDSESNKPNALLSLQARDLNLLYENQLIDGFKFLEINKILINFCDEMGKSERIANTVFPTTYNFYTRAFVWVFIVFITLVTAQTIGIWSILAGTLIGYVFLTIHMIGELLMNPFQDIATGIPLNQITRTIEINMLEALGEKEIPKPVEVVKGEYIM